MWDLGAPVDIRRRLNSATNLGNALAEYGEVTEAVEIGRRTLIDCRRVYGVDHAETIQIGSGLAMWLSRLDDDVAATNNYHINSYSSSSMESSLSPPAAMLGGHSTLNTVVLGEGISKYQIPPLRPP